MEARPFSNRAIRMLGSRLRRGMATEADQALLMQWIRSHDAPMVAVSTILRTELGYQNTPRLKTAGTLVDKLRREESNLFEMDDIAGVRLEPVSDRLRQDTVVQAIAERFPDCRVKDRRTTPNVGYRAVHVIVRLDVYRVEIQVRTRLQHLWAETNEKLADLAGRGLRYGEQHPDPVVASLHEIFIRVADAISDSEVLTAEFETLVRERKRRLGVKGDDWEIPNDIAKAQVVFDRGKGTMEELVDHMKEAVLKYEEIGQQSEDQ